MDAQRLLSACEGAGIDFFTGVPDSQLKGLCDSLYALYGVHSPRHIVAANEGNAVGLAAGHFLATGRPALCYMQNSGLGNAVNPLASLMDAQVYQLPCLLVVGWRGEPGVHDEPQHVKQGKSPCRSWRSLASRAASSARIQRRSSLRRISTSCANN